MWEWISAGLVLALVWLATRYMGLKTLEPVIERVEVPVQDNTQLLLLTEQLGSSQQQVKFLDATINTLKSSGSQVRDRFRKHSSRG